MNGQENSTCLLDLKTKLFETEEKFLTHFPFGSPHFCFSFQGLRPRPTPGTELGP